MINYYTHIITLPTTLKQILLHLDAVHLHNMQKIREEEKEKQPVTRAFVKVKKKKQPSLVDIISVFSEKDKITIDSTSSSFRAGRKLTLPCAYLQYAGILPDSLVMATVQTPYGSLVLAGLPELAPSPALSCWSVEYSMERFY